MAALGVGWGILRSCFSHGMVPKCGKDGGGGEGGWPGGLIPLGSGGGGGLLAHLAVSTGRPFTLAQTSR